MTQRPVDEELLFLFDEREICEMLWIFFSLLGLIELSHFRGHKDCGSDLFRSLIVWRGGWTPQKLSDRSVSEISGRTRIRIRPPGLQANLSAVWSISISQIEGASESLGGLVKTWTLDITRGSGSAGLHRAWEFLTSDRSWVMLKLLASRPHFGWCCLWSIVRGSQVNHRFYQPHLSPRTHYKQWCTNVIWLDENKKD